MNGNTPPRSRPIWPWLLGGCLFVIAILAAGAVLLWRYGTRKLTSAIEERATNPRLRAETARKMLGAKALPRGYYPVSATFEIPLLTHVCLSDRAPDERGGVFGYDKRGFVFTESLHAASSLPIEKFFRGDADAPADAEIIDVHLRAGEEVRRGVIETTGQKIHYRVVRGRVEEDDVAVNGLLALMLIDCPGRKKERTAVWFGPEGSEVADENAIRAFMSHFELCRAR